MDRSYSPGLRTGVLFSGVGTAGAYHAGVLKALAEAGVKVDVLAGHGAGTVAALCGAIDGGARLWEDAGPWGGSQLRRSYRWRTALKVAAAGVVAAALILVSPLLVLIYAAAMYAASLICSLVNLQAASVWLIESYRASIERLFLPPWIPTIVPRGLVLATLSVVVVLLIAAVRAALEERSGRRLRGAFWWRLIGVPLDSGEPSGVMLDTLWRLVRGASGAPRPGHAEVGRRYADLLTENFDQPGFRDVIVAVHDLDGRRDLVGVAVARRSRLVSDVRERALGPREAELVDFGAGASDRIVDFLLGSLRLPVASAPHLATFSAESYWSGESHRLCDRPELTIRLLDELAAAGIEQVVVVSAAPPPALPHSMTPKPMDLRARMGEYVRSVETATVRDAVAMAAVKFDGVFVVRPDHNPIGPFDFAPAYDEGSDRMRSIHELRDQGYRDAYRQFIEPMVASGERLEVG